MQGRLVIGYHLVWTAYGCWLPNDPRGSMSRVIRNDVTCVLGGRHYGRKQNQPSSATLGEFYDSADDILQYPRLEFNTSERNIVGESFAQIIAKVRYTCYACAIMPDHVHILIRKHKDKAEDMISKLQKSSRLRLREDESRTPDHPVWGGPGWKVFLYTPHDIRRVIAYIERNPIERRLSPQKWSFVTEYNGWPLHPGYDPNSPYARRLRDR